MRILVIEDEADLRNEMAEVLKERLVSVFPDVVVRKCATRDEFRGFLEKGEQFDISIVDVVLGERPRGYYTYLPDARGYEGIEIFQDHPQRLGKVIFITNSATHRRLRMLWSEIDNEMVCLKDLPFGTPPKKDWPQNLYTAINKAAGIRRSDGP